MILNYFKDRVKNIVMFLIIIAIFTIVLYGYNIPLNAIVYGTILTSVFILMVTIYDLYKYIERHKELERLRKSIDISIDGLVRGNTLIENDYVELINILFQENYRNNYEMDKNKTEMIDFYTLWVHQIKTPIAAMSMLLQESCDSEKGKLLNELFKIERYVELVLQYLRLESLTSDLKISKYNLQKIVKNAVKKYAPMFIHKKIQIELQHLDIDVITDEKWLTFVIEQLVSNALKYTNKGIVRIFLEGNNLCIEDTGVGISEEDLPRVFERGYTGFNGRMDRESTGLGLYLCKKILDKLNHKVNITSIENTGTKVFIDLSSIELF